MRRGLGSASAHCLLSSDFFRHRLFVLHVQMRGFVIDAIITACADAEKLLEHDAVISHLSSLTKARASSAANAGKQVCERGLCPTQVSKYVRGDCARN